MNVNWTRRQLLTRAGIAAAAVAGGGTAAGLYLGGCGTSSADGPTNATNKELQHFVSRPDLTPPRVFLSHNGITGPPQYLFLGLANSGPGQGGAMIMDTDGTLIWFNPDTVHNSKMDFQRQIYQGKPVLTWFQGRVVAGGHGEGVGKVADSSYREIATIHAHDGLMVDLHDFVVTPQGTALVTSFQTVSGIDLEQFGGSFDGVMLNGVAQEIDIATGELLFEWSAMHHVDLTESYQTVKGFGTKAKPWDYFHINSIAEYDDEHLLIGARNTWCVYLVRRSDGGIVWRLNGKKSDFAMGPGSQFYWQHDARWHPGSVLTLFDDGASPKEEKQSRALILDVDTKHMKVTLAKAFTNPGTPVLAHAMGNAQLLPDGGMFVGWGTNPYFSYFGPDGQLLLEGQLIKGDPTYRSFIGPWTGRPAEPPAIAARHHPRGAVVYASWNGATDVASWTVMAGQTKASLTPVGTARKTGFETAVAVRSAGPYFAAAPHDASGRPMSMSDPVRIA
jgi:Arylsulfotransferase (ASST)